MSSVIGTGGCGIYESIMEREMMMGRRRGIRYFQGTNALLYSAY